MKGNWLCPCIQGFYSNEFLGHDPLRAIQLIHELSLYSSVFMIPSSITSTFSADPAPSLIAVAAATVLQHLLDPSPRSAPFGHFPTLHKTLIPSITTPGTRARLFLAAALTPYRGISYTDSKGKPHPALEPVIREGTRLGAQNHYLDGIPALFSAAELLESPDLSNDKLKLPTDRVAIGKKKFSVPEMSPRLTLAPFTDRSNAEREMCS